MHAFLLALATLAICVGVSVADSADHARTAEIQRRLAGLSYNSGTAENEKALTELCRGNPDGIALLVSAARECEKNEERFHRICYFLQQLGPDAAAAVPALIEKLTGPYPDGMRREAASALGFIAKDSSPVAALVESLKTSPDESVRIRAAISLGSIRDPAAIPQLLIALNDRDADVRTNAGRALGDFDSDNLESQANAKVVAAVTLFPPIKNLSPEDAGQVLINISYKASLLINGQQLWTSPTRYVCDADNLWYEVVTPDGEKYRLTQQPAFLPERWPTRLDYGTYDILDSRGIPRGHAGQYWALWRETRTPRFDAVGKYRIKQAGTFRDERGTSRPIPFESNEISYEVNPQFASNANLLQQAREALKREFGVENSSAQAVTEDKDQIKVVTLNVSKQEYPEEKVVSTLPKRGTYFGMRFVCRFTPEGQHLSGTSAPIYRIICP